MNNAETPSSSIRSGMVAVVGRANVGKSTLINAMLGEKISIVSPVAQTTRNLIRGILTEPRGQLVFLDTPGVHKTAHDLGRLMNRIARTSVEGVDVIMLVLDLAQPPREEDEGWMRRIMRETARCVIALNKVDRGAGYADAYRTLWERLAKDKGNIPAVDWLTVSAATGAGVGELLNHLFRLVPEGPMLFPEDVLSDYPRKLAVADVIREKLFARLKEELPHAVAVWIEEIRDEDAGWQVDGYIYVNKPSQKRIVIGEKGRVIKTVSREAEKELAEIYERPVKINLWVKVEKDWARNFWMLKKLGYA